MRARADLRLVFWALLALALAAGAAAAAEPPRYLAAIDLGPSSVKLLIRDREGNVVVDQKISTGLGKDLDADRLLKGKNRRDTVRALRRLIARAAKPPFRIAPGEIEVIATAAVRNAKGRVTA